MDSVAHSWLGLVLAPLAQTGDASGSLSCTYVRVSTDEADVLPVYHDRHGRIELGATGLYLDTTRRRLEWRNVRDDIIGVWVAPGGESSDLAASVFPLTPDPVSADALEKLLSRNEDEWADALEPYLDEINAAYREALREPLRQALGFPSIPSYVPRSMADHREAAERAKDLLAQTPPPDGGRWLLPGVLSAEQIVDIIWRVLHGMGVKKNDYIATRGPTHITGLRRCGPSPLRTETLHTAILRGKKGHTSRPRVLCGATPCTGNLGEVWRVDEAGPRAVAFRSWAFLTRGAGDGEPSVGEWLLSHKDGYWWDGWVYSVVNPKRDTVDPLARWGILPKPLQNASAIGNKGYGFVGRFPSPPCVIRCRQCEQLSEVTATALDNLHGVP